MRLIKLAILSFVFLFLAVTLVSFLIPSHIRLSKVIMLQGSRDSVFQLITNKDQWPRWHPLFSPLQTAEQKTALNEIETKLISRNDSLLQMQWQQPGKKTLLSNWVFRNDTSANVSTLQWFIDFDHAWYPWEKLKSLFYEKTYGTMMEQGLLNLKQQVESKPGK